MNKSDLLMLYDYNYWANARVLNAASRVSAEQFAAPNRLSHGSLRGTLVHTFGTEVVWRLRCQEGVSPAALPTENEFLSLEALRQRWRAEEQRMRAFLASLSDEDVNRRVQYKTTRGVPYENVLWHLLVHIVNHGTQFRSEAAVALTDYGCSPGDLDMLVLFRAQAT